MSGLRAHRGTAPAKHVIVDRAHSCRTTTTRVLVRNQPNPNPLKNFPPHHPSLLHPSGSRTRSRTRSHTRSRTRSRNACGHDHSSMVCGCISSSSIMTFTFNLAKQATATNVGMSSGSTPLCIVKVRDDLFRRERGHDWIGTLIIQYVHAIFLYVLITSSFTIYCFIVVV